MSTEISNNIVTKIYKQFDKNSNQRLSKFEFVQSINYLSKKVGGMVCCRNDLDSLFQIIDINGDESISRKEYSVLIDKFIKILGHQSAAYEKMLRLANSHKA